MKKPIRITVDNRLRIAAPLPMEVRESLDRAFTHKNPQRAKAERTLGQLRPGTPYRQIAALKAQMKSEPKYIETWRDEPSRGYSVPRGGLLRLREILEGNDYELDVLDCRCEGDPDLRHAYTHHLELRDYQTLIVDATNETEQGIARSPTGSGKTSALIAAAVRMGRPAMIAVHRTQLMEQWVRRLCVELKIDENEVGIVAGSKMRIRPITIGMLLTLKNRVDKDPQFAKRFGFFGMDEVHLAAANSFLGVIDAFPARYRIGVSDDERRKDGKEFLIYDMFGERIAEVDRDGLVEQGVIFDVEIRLVPTTFAREWWDRAPENTRPLMWDRLLEELTNDEERNRLLVDVAHAETKKGEQVLFFSHRVAHCEELRAQFAARDPRVGLMVGGADNAFEFTRSIAGLMDRSVVAAFGTYQAIGPSLDLPGVGRGIATTPIHNNRQFVNQVRGRLCRRPDGKLDAVLFYAYDVRIFGLAPAEKLARIATVAKVLDGGQWIEARAWIKAEKARREAETGE